MTYQTKEKRLGIDMFLLEWLHHRVLSSYWVGSKVSPLYGTFST